MNQSTRKQVEFHISRKTRDKYGFDESLFTSSGNVILANFYATRLFAQKINDKRDLIRFPEQAVKAGQINAMGLIDEILHYVVKLYQEQIKPNVMTEAFEYMVHRLGEDQVQSTLRQFAEEFPTIQVYLRSLSAVDYLKGETDGIANRNIAMEEMLLLWLANVNPAFSPYLELFDDETLEKTTSYHQMISLMREFFEEQPGFGPDNQNLVEMLRTPALVVPHSLPGQLEYIREKWGKLLGKFLYRLLGSLDLIREEEKMHFIGPGPMQSYEFTGVEFEQENYSHDRDWMPKIVIIAKSTYVWLDQLSKKYGRSIQRLDQIPDEELDTLARWGFSGLWLIGLWQRSEASKNIKRMCGNPEAEASAYSLFDYQIAEALGGEPAFQNLKDRAWQRGIRMAGDMVPNHVGIDGKWVIEHPDWFIALDYSPFPSYSFNSPDFSWDGRVGIYLEDHYFSRTDAAVVFKRVDKWTNSVKYIYHGNDGTSMPWNDTAQLNYLNPDLREAVINTILHVAQKFPIIRFDAAMTLTKRHFQRLWFPQPGTGGDIPTRAEYGMTRDQFDQAMPKEFWREVVDRVAEKMPDTLLLAEAFWLMEGYFTRTLGMHRVYNSAFMNMLKNEDNAKYRTSIKNVLEFDPEILKRFVNFMNNPDEETAVAQFGKEDKYFGVCMMMVTMPGLPMFGHGQIEGFTEKYGMEYRKAYWDEIPDLHLIQRHEREIFPLMKRRHLFSDVKNFLLYDFYNPEGYVNENVFAYSNRAGNDSALVVYNNKYDRAKGWVHRSAAFTMKENSDEGRYLSQKNLGEGLLLRNDHNFYCIFKDQLSGMEFIRSSREMHDKGLYVELDGYSYHVFLNFREVEDNVWHHYGNLASFLNGRGVPNIEEALKETFLQPIHLPLKEIINAGMLDYILGNRLFKAGDKIDAKLYDEVDRKIDDLLQEIQKFTNSRDNVHDLKTSIMNEFDAILHLPIIGHKLNLDQSRKYKPIVKYIKNRLNDDGLTWNVLIGWWITHSLGKVATEEHYEQQSRSWIDEWLFGKVISGAFQEQGMANSNIWYTIELIKLLTSNQEWYINTEEDPQIRLFTVLNRLFKNDEIQAFLRVNRYKDVLWYNKESFEELCWWLFITSVIKTMSINHRPVSEVVNDILELFKTIQLFDKQKEASEYRVEKLLNFN
ncbi:alpha-amylase [candidate division KSB1 bacterium]|nr:alpha-amylase [candidate division KSB1 bacterium]